MKLELTDHRTLNVTSPTDALLIGGPIPELQSPLHPEETPYIHEAIEKRVHEFTAGRTLARLAMQALTLPPAAVTRGEKRNPIWPKGLVGSITHTDTHCICALARSEHVEAVGIDSEQTHRVSRDLWDKLFTPDEQNYLNALADPDQQHAATVIFSAKEAFYKLQYPLTNAWLGFEDVTVQIHNNTRFTVQLLAQSSALGTTFQELEGSYHSPYPNTILSQIWLAASNKK